MNFILWLQRNKQIIIGYSYHICYSCRYLINKNLLIIKNIDFFIAHIYK